MGLDMYLKRTKRINGLKTADYLKIDDVVYGGQNVATAKQIDLEKVTFIPNANECKDAITQCGEFVHWVSIFHEAGYWRKANQIHAWFVKHVQNGEDDCGYYEVSKEQIEQLLKVVTEVLIRKDENYAVRNLPTQDGFFFGGTEYDEDYWQDLEDTKKTLEKILSETDFEKQILFYHSSW